MGACRRPPQTGTESKDLWIDIDLTLISRKSVGLMSNRCRIDNRYRSEGVFVIWRARFDQDGCRHMHWDIDLRGL